MTQEELKKIAERAFAAKEYDYTVDEHADFECPLCVNGYVDGTRYDAKMEAATVVAYGIGEGLRCAEEWVTHGPNDVLALIAEIEKRFEAGRRAGIEEALVACKPPNEEAKTEFDAGADYAILDCIAKIRALLEAK